MTQLAGLDEVFFEEELATEEDSDMTAPAENIPDDVEPEAPDA